MVRRATCRNRIWFDCGAEASGVKVIVPRSPARAASTFAPASTAATAASCFEIDREPAGRQVLGPDDIPLDAQRHSADAGRRLGEAGDPTSGAGSERSRRHGQPPVRQYRPAVRSPTAAPPAPQRFPAAGCERSHARASGGLPRSEARISRPRTRCLGRPYMRRPGHLARIRRRARRCGAAPGSNRGRSAARNRHGRMRRAVVRASEASRQRSSGRLQRQVSRRSCCLNRFRSRFDSQRSTA